MHPYSRLASRGAETEPLEQAGATYDETGDLQRTRGELASDVAHVPEVVTRLGPHVEA
jgi:hypothetical protein